MKLGEALSVLKKEQRRLARLRSLRKENVCRVKGERAKFNPAKLSDEIEAELNAIRKLKIQIQKTNLSTKVKGERITLAEAILKVQDLREQIKDLSTLFDDRKDYLFRDRNEVKKIAQVNEAKVEDTLQLLEVKKAQLDNSIQITNWDTTLLE